MTGDETLHTQLRRIADDPACSPVIRMAAKRAAVEMRDGPAMPDREVHAMLRQAIIGRPAGTPDSIERLRARLSPVVAARPRLPSKRCTCYAPGRHGHHCGEGRDAVTATSHLIAVKVVPDGDGQYRMHIDSTHPDRAWTARALRLAADSMMIPEDGPAVTVSGQLVERLSGYGPTGETQP